MDEELINNSVHCCVKRYLFNRQWSTEMVVLLLRTNAEGKRNVGLVPRLKPSQELGDRRDEDK